MRRKGIGLIELICVLTVLLVLALIGNPSLNEEAIKDKIMKDKSYTLDQALAIWYRGNGYTYPNNLDDLKEYKILPANESTSDFRYITDSNKTKYGLEYTQSSGEKVLSPGSTLR